MAPRWTPPRRLTARRSAGLITSKRAHENVARFTRCDVRGSALRRGPRTLRLRRRPAHAVRANVQKWAQFCTPYGATLRDAADTAGAINPDSRTGAMRGLGAGFRRTLPAAAATRAAPCTVFAQPMQ